MPILVVKIPFWDQVKYDVKQDKVVILEKTTQIGGLAVFYARRGL